MCHWVARNVLFAGRKAFESYGGGGTGDDAGRTWSERMSNNRAVLSSEPVAKAKPFGWNETLF